MYICLIVQKQLKTYLLTALLAIIAIYSTVFTQFTAATFSNTSLYTQLSTSEEDPDTIGNKALALEISSEHSPLQAVKAEETITTVTQRTKPVYNLFSIALLLVGFENESYQIEASFFRVKPLYFSAPIYILFRQIII
jgi:hypothetical protein